MPRVPSLAWDMVRGVEHKLSVPPESATERVSGYRNPPILESTLTIDVDRIPVDRHAMLGRVDRNLDPSFTGVSTLSASGFSGTIASKVGIAFTTGDGKETVQATPDSLTFSCQAPYPGWDKFLARAQEAWAAYKAAVETVTARKCSVKYVNSIGIPINVPLRELFNTYPAIPEESPVQLFNAISMFYTMSITSLPGAELSVLMTSIQQNARFTNPQSAVPPPADGARILLDNTVTFRPSNEDEMWALMPEVRRVKNFAFESQLSPRLKEAFN